MQWIMIEKRFCGPPNSANGGYVCGLLAGHIDGSAEITLRVPPPLGHRLGVVASVHGGVELREDATVLATSRFQKSQWLPSRRQKTRFAERHTMKATTSCRPALCADRRGCTVTAFESSPVHCPYARMLRLEQSRHPGFPTPIC
jgi:hypothetical protein